MSNEISSVGFRITNVAALLIFFFAGNLPSSGETKNGRLVATGIREWQLTDGSKKRYRLQLVDGNVAHLSEDGAKTTGIEFDRFVPEQKQLLESIAKGAVVLIVPKGIGTSVESPSGKIAWRVEQQTSAVVGAEREWTNRDGKKAKGALLNIADDEISILVEDIACKIPWETLSETDQQYVDRVKKGMEPLFPWRVSFPAFSNSNDLSPVWGSVSGERFLKPVDPRISFEQAVKIATDHMRSGMNQKFWQLRYADERSWKIPKQQAEELGASNAEVVRRGYTLWFAIHPSKIDEAKKVFPHFNNRDGNYYVYLFDDGRFPDLRFQPLAK